MCRCARPRLCRCAEVFESLTVRRVVPGQPIHPCCPLSFLMRGTAWAVMLSHVVGRGSWCLSPRLDACGFYSL